MKKYNYNIEMEKIVSQPFIVCDLEATCWDRNIQQQTVGIMEIIEIGAVKTDYSGKIHDEFSIFVKPNKNPILSEFCKNLTTIKQSDIDNAPNYIEAIDIFNEWLGDVKGHAWFSWGNYDKNQFIVEYNRNGVFPTLMNIPHINLKRPWRKTTKHKRQGLRAALSYHGYQFEGTPHRGIDDVKNIAKIIPHTDKYILRNEISNWSGPEFNKEKK